MSPFKKKYKFSIIEEKNIEENERMLKCFLSDDIKEAEDVYKKFEPVLSKMAFKYSSMTGLSRNDLFQEGLIGLARACRDWDLNRSNNFKIYAIYRIKDALLEYVKNNEHQLNIPMYIKKSSVYLKNIKEICSSLNQNYFDVLNGNTKLNLDDVVQYKYYEDMINKFVNVAKRANISTETLILRVESVPTSNVTNNDVSLDNNKKLQSEIRNLDNFKNSMTREEIKICEGLVYGKTVLEIANEFDKSKNWVYLKIKKLKKKIRRINNFEDAGSSRVVTSKNNK